MSELDQVQKEVLTTLQGLDTPASQKVIREDVGCPKSTLHNKLKDLEDNDYVVDKSGFGDNSSKYVLNDDVNVSTSYRFEVIRDTQLVLHLLQVVFFSVLIGGLIFYVNITQSIALMLYGSFILGILPSLVLHVVQKFNDESLYEINIDVKE